MQTEMILLKTGFQQAKVITRRYATTFYWASLLLAVNKRLAAYSVYAFCRISDETVDGGKPAAFADEIKTLREKLTRVYGTKVLDEPLLACLRKTIKQYNIPRQYFNLLLEGMEMDIVKNRYRDFQELYEYCYRVAGAVGLIMEKIFGANEAGAQLYAVDLGIAMQLTNIIRDIKEDYQRGRVYIPQDEMRTFGVTDEDIANNAVNPKIKGLLSFQLERARHYYRASTAGITLLKDKRSRLVVCVMKELYSGILDVIEKREYDVFKTRAYVSRRGKITRLLKIMGRKI